MTTSTEQGTASIRFYRDGTVTAAIPGVENRPIRGVDSAGAHRMVRERLLQAAAVLGHPLEVTAEEANGEVWAFVVDPTLGAAGEVRDERLITEARPTPGWLPAAELPEDPTAADIPDEEEREEEREEREENVAVVPSRPAPPRLPSVPLRLPVSAPPVAPPVAPRGFDADPRPNLPGRRDLVDTRPQARGGPATMGWQGAAESLLGWAGWHPAPSRQEKEHRHELRIIQRPLPTAKLIAVVNPTGGVGKSTLTLALAAAISRHQSRGVLAWDLNPNKGTLGMRTSASEEQAALTAEDLLAALPQFEAGRPLSDLDTFVRPQGEQRFEVLAAPRAAAGGLGAAGDETAWMRTEGGWVIGWDEFHRLYPWLASYYRAIVADTGNKQDPVWWAIMSRAHQLVIPLSLSEHAIDVTLDTCDDLERAGLAHLVRDAVTVINSPAQVGGWQARRQRERVHRFFGPQPDGQPGRTRAVLEMPFDPALALGQQVDFTRIPERRLRAHQRVAAAAMERL
jgi:energy-coupling factor transporter ATP-binding protein EcfA2